MKIILIFSAVFLSLSSSANSETLNVRLQCGFAGPELTATVVTPTVSTIYSDDDGSAKCASASSVQVIVGNYTYASSSSFLVHNEISYLVGNTKWDAAANGCSDDGFYGEINVVDQHGYQGQLFYNLVRGKIIPREISNAQQICSIEITQ